MSVDDPHGPPRPLPSYLQPNAGPIWEGDLRLAISTAGLRQLAKLLDVERLAGQVLLTLREGSPWLEVAVAVPMYGEGRAFVARELDDTLLASGGLVHKFAVWRYTEAVYRVGADGAVEDDPIELGGRQ